MGVIVRVPVLRLLHPFGLRNIGARGVGAEQFVRLGLVGGDRASWPVSV